MSLQGQAVTGSGGIVCATVQKLDSQDQIIPEYSIHAQRFDAEKKRFLNAVAQASQSLQEEISALQGHPHAKGLLPVLETHLMMLSDPELHDITQRFIEDKSINVEWALKFCLAGFVQAFAEMDNVYLKSRQADIEQVGKRLLHYLMDQTKVDEPVHAIIVAQDFSPSEIVRLWRLGAVGFVAAQGGKGSHAMIVARGVGLTGLAGAQTLWSAVKDGDKLILDAENNTWLLNPSQEQEQHCQDLQKALHDKQESLQSYATQATSRERSDGISLLANVEFVEEITLANQYEVDGIGLFRTEFLFMQSAALPTEDEQYDYYHAMVQGMNGKPITFRLLDVGADKLAHARIFFGDYDGENPALGLRGVRMLLHKPNLLKTQLRAILRCADEGDISILVPMVVAAEEVSAVRQVMVEVQQELGLKSDITLGCMIEVPGAALVADDLAQVSDFFSIGSNDLVQYTLAVDRADEHVSYLYDANHPAVKCLIQMAVDAAQKNDIPVIVCGELAASKAWTQTFVDMKVDALSMASSSVLTIRKQLSDLSN
ncbi:MAG: phosphoenolpyruvate--protein phosphotransferase [Ghiorsea sp.]|nr:phosphoenolpyruvate--protein phosphotransferase [Ghiorsea sp.]